jgi:hypothetical protein
MQNPQKEHPANDLTARFCDLVGLVAAAGLIVLALNLTPR